MNQILSTDMPKDNNKQKKVRSSNIGKSANTTRNILRVFAILMIIFGTLLIGTGGYLMFKTQNQEETQNLEPTIAIEDKTDKLILVKITHKLNIEEVEYWWNNGRKTTINGNNGKYLEKEITVPSGKSTLHLLIKDIEGNEIPYEKQYETESGIEISVTGNKIAISYDGDTQISYMTYRWDEEEEKQVQINNTTIDEQIEAIKGLHKLTVILVDENNQTYTKEQMINGVSKPKIEIAVDETQTHFVVNATDEEQIKEIEVRIDQDDNKLVILDVKDQNLKEWKYTIPLVLHEGANFIEVKVTNTSDVSEEIGAKFTK